MLARGVISSADSYVKVSDDIVVSGNGAQAVIANGGKVGISGDIYATDEYSSASGISAGNGSEVIADGNIRVEASGNPHQHGSQAVASYNASAVTVNGNISMDAKYASAVYAYNGAAQINGNIDVSGDDSLAVWALGQGIVNVSGDVTMNGSHNQSIFGVGGVHVWYGATANISGNVSVEGDDTIAVATKYLDGGTVNVYGDVTVSGDSVKGVYGESGDIYVSGSVSAVGENSYGVAAYNGSSVTVGGAVLLSGDVTDTTPGTTYSGVYANQSSVTVGGGVVTSGDALKSVMADTGSVVSINGGIKTVGDSAMSLYLYRDSEAYVTGNIESTGDRAAGIAMHSNNYALIDGDITVSGGSNLNGASLNWGSSADIYGDITVSGGNYLEGLTINNGSKVLLDGNIKLTGGNYLWGVLAHTDSATSFANITGNVYVSGDSRVQAVRAMQSDVVIEGKITALAGSDAFGVVATNDTGMDGGVGSSRVSVSGDIYVSGADGGGIDALFGSKIDVTGNVTVIGDNSFGAVSNMAGSYVAIDGNVTVTGANSTGLYASDDASVYMNGDRLDTSGTDSKAMRVEAGGTITLDSVTAGNLATGQTIAYTKSNGSIYADNGSALYGDIINNNNTAGPERLMVTLDGASALYGTVNDASTLTGTILTLSDAASSWHVAGDSSLYGLNVDGSTVDFRSAPAFTTVNLQGLNDNGSLSSIGGKFIMKANIATQDADLLVVSGVSAAHGTHDITVMNIGNARTDGTEVVTLADTSALSDVEFRLTNVVEQGGWQYTMQTADSSQMAVSPGGGGVAYGTLWQLRGNGASNTGDAAINNFIGSYLMSYAETSTLLQRLGQLHETPYLSGLWARIHGGKFESNSRSYVRNFDMDYGGIQIGYDRKYEIGWNGDFYAGVMFGYGKGDLDYSTAGSGEVETKTAGVYATFTSPGGFYVDAVLKYVWMDNDFDTIDSAGTFVKGGEISSGGIGYSVEAGQRIGLGGNDRNGWYLEPQVQLSRTRYDGGYFNASNGLHIGTEPFTSILGRLGLLAGYETEKTNLYAKVSKVREFDGELSIRANGSPVTESMEGSWWVYGLGFTSRLSDRNNIYLDVERAEGGKFTQPWRINAGWRVEF